MKERFNVISKLGTEYIVQPTVLEGKEYFVVLWKNEEGEYSSDVQSKETVDEHIKDGSWKVKE